MSTFSVTTRRRVSGSLILLACGWMPLPAIAAMASGEGKPPEVAELVTPDESPETNAEFSDDASFDAQATFDRLVARYRSLTQYSDDVVVEHVTARNGEPAVREETHVACEIDDSGRLAVRTPSNQLSDVLGFGCFVPSESDEAEASSSAPLQEDDLDFWLAPHMALRFSDEPLQQFRSGVREGFTPVRAERVSLEEVDLVRLDLQSGDGLSENYQARFELYIDPTTWLVKRIRGVQLMPDGANLLTEYTITPKRVVSTDETKPKTRSAT